MATLLRSRKIPFRLLSMVLPVFAIGLLGYTGNVLLHAFASQEPAAPQATLAPPAEALPAVAASACCRLQVNSSTRPDPNSMRLTLNVTLSNISPEILQTSPGLQMTVMDAAGVIHSYTAAYLPADAGVGGPLKPGASRTENLDFDVPPAVAARSLSFQLDAAHAPITVAVR